MRALLVFVHYAFVRRALNTISGFPVHFAYVADSTHVKVSSNHSVADIVPLSNDAVFGTPTNKKKVVASATNKV